MKNSFKSIKRHLKFNIFEFFDQVIRKSIINFRSNELFSSLKCFFKHILTDENVKIDFSKYSYQGNSFGLITKFLSKISFIKCVNLNFYNKYYGIKIAEEIDKVIPYFKDLICLRIYLGRNYISDDGAKILSKSISKFSNLNTLALDLSHNHIGNKGIKYLSKAFSNLIALEKFELNLGNYNTSNEDELNCLVNNITPISISDSGFLHLVESIKSLKSIRVLKLYFTGNSLKSDSMKCLSKILTNFENLVTFHLYLTNNKISNTGMNYLLRTLKSLSNLSDLHLFLGDTGINDNCINDILENISNNYTELKLFLNENKFLTKRQILKDKYGDNVIF